jgi:hypothetical protein
MCGFGMECRAATCVSTTVTASLSPPIIIGEVISAFLYMLRLFGGEALEQAPSLLALLILLAVAAAAISYNRLRILFPKGALTGSERHKMLAIRAAAAIAAFTLPFVVNRTLGIIPAIIWALAEIAFAILLDYAKKRLMERKAIKV